jgi:hypothetical protein
MTVTGCRRKRGRRHVCDASAGCLIPCVMKQVDTDKMRDWASNESIKTLPYLVRPADAGLATVLHMSASMPPVLLSFA